MTKEQANAFRKGPTYEKGVLMSIHLNILGITEKAFDKNPMFRKSDNVRELENSYIYRSLACAYFLFMEWYLKGGLKDVKEKKLMNDMFDSQIATYATYFDGLLTNDIKANRSYQTLRYFLKNTSAEIYDAGVMQAQILKIRND